MPDPAIVTSKEAIRKGFKEQAIEKGKKGSPFVAEANDLNEQLSTAASFEDLINDENCMK